MRVRKQNSAGTDNCSTKLQRQKTISRSANSCEQTQLENGHTDQCEPQLHAGDGSSARKTDPRKQVPPTSDNVRYVKLIPEKAAISLRLAGIYHNPAVTTNLGLFASHAAETPDSTCTRTNPLTNGSVAFATPDPVPQE
ncbi:MAG: hypothetical protein RLZZ232_2276 [Planctomycetota bacterium]